MSHVLIVDDEPSICWGFREFLTEGGHEVSVAPSAEEAVQIAAGRAPDAVVLDIRLPGMDGLSAMRQLRVHTGDAPIIVMTAFGNLETAVRAIAEGAFDYLPKPFDLGQAAAVVHRALQRGRRAHPVPGETSVPDAADALIGGSTAMQQVFKQIALVAPADVPVLITGESGTGKELVARAIHRHSARRDGPFLPVCLAALSPGLVESELFGHARGSFTGATQDRRGLLELGHRGTVLLDEIADTSPALQVKLLRALEHREITPVGDAQPRATDIRILAATNRPLPQLIAAGQFREDLFFRLSVFHIHLPPLRERTEDIPDLAAYLLSRTSGVGRELHLSPDAREELCSRLWPGNVRELRNAVEHAAIMARGGEIRREHLPAATPGPADPTLPQSMQHQIREWALRTVQERQQNQDGSASAIYEDFLRIAEPPLLRAVLEACGKNRALTAKLLGLHRATLRQKLNSHEIG